MLDQAKIVVRYADGKTLKGYSHDFSPFAASFHIRDRALGGPQEGQEVFISDLKAVFFVRDFHGDNSREDRKHFLSGNLMSGRKVQVLFKDGEVLVGSTAGYDRHRPGFFVFPADPRSNNIRVYVVMAAIKDVHFLSASPIGQ